MPEPEATPEVTPEVKPEVKPEAVKSAAPGTVAVATPNMPQDPASKSAEPQTPEFDFHKLVPVEFQQKPYMKEVNSFDKMFKDFDNAQSLIGQKQAVIPAPDAAPEVWDAYFSKVRPEKADAYNLPETEYVKKFGRDEEFGNTMKGLFHKAGLHQSQIDILTQGYDGILLEKAKGTADEAAKQSADFEKLADGLFGDKKDEKLKIANALLKEHTPKELQPHLQSLSNDNLTIMASILNSFHDKYMSEDNLNFGGKGSEGDANAARAEAQQLMADPSYKDFRHPKHDATVARVNELYARIGKMS